MRTPVKGLREARPPPGAACDHPPGAPPTLREPGRPSTAPLLASPHPTGPALYRQRGGWDRAAWTHLPGGTWQRVSPLPRSPGRRRRDRRAAAERGGGSRCPSNGAALATERPAYFRRRPTPQAWLAVGSAHRSYPELLLVHLSFPAHQSSCHSNPTPRPFQYLRRGNALSGWRRGVTASTE